MEYEVTVCNICHLKGMLDRSQCGAVCKAAESNFQVNMHLMSKVLHSARIQYMQRHGVKGQVANMQQCL